MQWYEKDLSGQQCKSAPTYIITAKSGTCAKLIEDAYFQCYNQQLLQLADPPYH
jgi:hypothetical protein